MAQAPLSVYQVNRYIASIFRSDYMLGSVSVRGEVSNLKYHNSGHIYFSLKDEKATISCIMFAGNRKNLSFRLEEGQQIICTGSVEVYERDGKYQLYAKQIRQDGAGALFEAFLRTRDRLNEMGMFDAAYKKPIPKYAMRVGIVTAPTGAAIRDIETVSHARNPYVQLILYPALVQGSGAAQSIANGIARLDRENCDVIIIGRGGGSIEDLWAFNEELVAQAIFASQTPIVSAVGHETDTTISDYVADLRVPTPTAAAEACVWDLQTALLNADGLHDSFEKVFRHRLTAEKERVVRYEKKFLQLSPENRLHQKQMRATQLEERLQISLERKFNRRRETFRILLERLKVMSPLQKLEQGYAYTRTADGTALKHAAQVTIGDTVHIHLIDGILDTRVTEVRTEKTYE